MATGEAPTSAYFRPKHGAWEGRLDFELASLRALLASDVGLVDGLAFFGLWLLCRVAGPLRIETRVLADALADGRVEHTTRISKFRVVLQESEERFDLAADGRTFAVSGALRMMPLRSRRIPYAESSRGEIDERGECARYDFAWRHVALVQRSTPGPEGLRFEQTLAFGTIRFVLTPKRPGAPER